MKVKILSIIFLFSVVELSFSQTEFFIKYKSTVSFADISKNINNNIISAQFENRLGKSYSFKLSPIIERMHDDHDVFRIVKISLDDSNSFQSFYENLSNDPSIEYIQEINTYKIDFIPNDSLISEQWYLDKISAFEAWNIQQGNDEIIVAIIDTGIDYLHPDLKNNIWINDAEELNKNGKYDKEDEDGIDNDRNGFIDDIFGWDFTDRSGFPYDSLQYDYIDRDNDPFDEGFTAHGSKVAGIIGAEKNNNLGIAGIASGVKLMNLRAFDPSGYGDEDDVAAAIIYAVKNGAKVINMSFGDDKFSLVLRDVLRYAYDKNVVLIASAGNSNTNVLHYPSSYSEVISVGASTQNDSKASFSNYGSTIDIVAPGQLNMTTDNKGGYETFSGTSAAAPIVSAGAALLLSIKNFSNEEIKQILKSTSDDIGQIGWDLYSGAGRINLLKAVSSLPASIIKINSPLQDFHSNGNNFPIIITVLSPYFSKFDLFYGIGLDPSEWRPLSLENRTQVLEEKILEFNVSELLDTVFTLRLSLKLSNGRVLEERTNFYIDRTAPQAEIISLTPIYYGDKPTIASEILTDDLCSVKMFFRKSGDVLFNAVSLDGLFPNSLFIKKIHYGFIPLDFMMADYEFELYFEIENMSGLKTILDNGSQLYKIKSNSSPSFISYNILQYKLPAGEIYPNKFRLGNRNNFSIAVNELDRPRITTFYSFNNGNFTLEDSILQRIPKSIGDFNRNGKTDILSSWFYAGFIDEQESETSTRFVNLFKDSTSSFWPMKVHDFYKDGFEEVLSLNENDTKIKLSRINKDLLIEHLFTLENFSSEDSIYEFTNKFLFTNVAIADVDNDLVEEILAVDYDGDILIYKVRPDGIENHLSIENDFTSSIGLITTGNFDGDEYTDIAVLLESSEYYSIAPYYKLIVFSLINNQPKIIYEESFFNASEEFSSILIQTTEKSMSFGNLDSDNLDELAVSFFPYAFVFDYSDSKTKIIYFTDYNNSPSIFIDDLNENGINEIAFSNNKEIVFIELYNSDDTFLPFNLKGSSLDSNNASLTWEGGGDQFYIYRGNSEDNLELLDSTNNHFYTDDDLINNKYYYYSVKSLTNGIEKKLSNFSNIFVLYSHEPAKIDYLTVLNNKSIKINFTERINSDVILLNSFEVIGKGYPNSISSADQFSYVINFQESLSIGDHFLIVKNLFDFYDSSIQEDTILFSISDEIKSDKFYITSFNKSEEKAIEITFNLPVDEESANQLSNYTFDPYNEIVSVSVNSNKVLIETKNPVGSIGIEYKLTLTNLSSTLEAGKIGIESGAGSTIIISFTSENLANVFVYPNPVKIFNNTEKITFANIPKNTEIIIFNLSGKKVKTIKSLSYTGGINWDLRDEENEIIPTGIYIYRIISYDDNQNKIEEKLEKFAVIK